jgi:uncharacterized protein
VFLPNVGPGMLRDSDPPQTMRVLERALSALPNIEASAIIAADSGKLGSGPLCGRSLLSG